MKNLSAAFAAALLLQGCAYAISSSFVQQVDRSVTFEQLAADPDLQEGKIFILGGTIVGSEAAAKGSLVTVTQRPLDYWGKPIRTNRTGGRFLIYSPKRLDPFVYAPGRELTVAGEAAGTKPAALGGREFIDPVLVLREVRLWEQPYAAPPGQRQWGDPLLYDPNRQPGRPE